MHVFTAVKSVTKTDILCAVIEHNAQQKEYANMFQTRKNKINKKYTTYLALLLYLKMP